MILFDGLSLLFNSPTTVKVIATENRAGGINVDFRSHLYMDSHGSIYLFEAAEYSSLSCNLAYSLWFSKNAVISILRDFRQAFEIQVKVERAIVSGNEFRKACEWLAEDYELFDLSSVWVLEPLEIQDISSLTQTRYERKNKLMISHLDRLAKKENLYEQKKQEEFIKSE